MAYKIKSKFRSWQKQHPNCMTPYIIETIQKDDMIIEVSEGTGFNNNKIYGVSLIHYKDGKFETDTSEKSKMFFSKEEAIKYARDLK